MLIGRMTADPELKKTPSDVSVTSFSIAVNRPKNKDGEQVADFINVVAWRGTAEFISKYFHKGSAIFIEGSLQTRTYEDKEGKKRTIYEVLANTVDFMEGKKENNGNGNFMANAHDFEEVSVEEDTLPFN
jgi:single-strand DNA-binding protein